MVTPGAIPAVPTISTAGPRPTWSVMIPTYNCAEFLANTLMGVLAQDPGPEAMQIEVVDDCSTEDAPDQVVADIGRGRVGFHRRERNVGISRNLTSCLTRSRDRWVVLHGDDVVYPEFYSTVTSMLDADAGGWWSPRMTSTTTAPFGYVPSDRLKPCSIMPQTCLSFRLGPTTRRLSPSRRWRAGHRWCPLTWVAWSSWCAPG